MTIYALLILLILLLPLFKVPKKTYCIICGFCVLLIVGLRSIHLGQKDTEFVYKVIFDLFSENNWAETFIYIHNQNIEYVFYIIMKLFTVFSHNYQLYLFLIACPYVFAVSYLIYKYSKIPTLSYILFLSLNYFSLSFTLLRHVVAMAFLIAALHALINKKNKSFFIYVFLASLFHRTALIFLLIYPLSKIKFSYYYYFFIAFTLFMVTCFGNQIMNILFMILKNPHFLFYQNQDGDTLTFFAINLLILLFCNIYAKKYLKNNFHEANILFNTQFLATLFASCTLLLGEFFRISSYFGIFSIILLPNCLSFESNKKVQTIFYLLQVCVFVAYFVLFTVHNTSIYPYQFFWNGGF